MPRSDLDVKAYLSEILKDAPDLPADKREVVESVLMDDRIQGRIADSVLRHQDYSRHSARVLAKEREIEQRQQELTNWYNQQIETVRANQDEFQRAQDQISQYKSKYGDLTEEESSMQQTPKADPGYMTRNEFQADIQNRELAAIDFAAKLQKISNEHYAEFKEPLDTEALKNQALQTRVPINSAYDQMVAERRAKAREDDIQRRLAEAEERGRKSALSGARLPISPVVGDDMMHPIEANRAMLGSKDRMPAYKRGLQEFLDGTLGK